MIVIAIIITKIQKNVKGVGEKMEKDLTELKQPFSGYMKYSIILDLKKVAKKTERTLSEIMESALVEYFEKYNLLGENPGDV